MLAFFFSSFFLHLLGAADKYHTFSCDMPIHLILRFSLRAFLHHIFIVAVVTMPKCTCRRHRRCRRLSLRSKWIGTDRPFLNSIGGVDLRIHRSSPFALYVLFTHFYTFFFSLSISFFLSFFLTLVLGSIERSMATVSGVKIKFISGAQTTITTEKENQTNEREKKRTNTHTHEMNAAVRDKIFLEHSMRC